MAEEHKRLVKDITGNSNSFGDILNVYIKPSPKITMSAPLIFIYLEPFDLAVSKHHDSLMKLNAGKEEKKQAEEEIVEAEREIQKAQRKRAEAEG